MLGSTTGNTLQDISLAVQQRIKATGFNYSAYKKINIPACDLCESASNDWELYSHQDRYKLPVRSMRCKKCGLIFITPRMISTAYDDFYTNWYRKLTAAFSNNPNPEGSREQSSSLQADAMMKFLGNHMPVDLEIKNVLDVGGSTGSFIEKVCKVTGAKGVVVDPNKTEIQQAAKKGLAVSCCSFADYKTDKKYELVSMLRTVEHLLSINFSLKKVAGLLTKGGMLILDIVNHDWLLKMFHDKTVCTKIDHVYQLTDKVICQYFNICFPGCTIKKSEVNARYISYLVRTK